MTYKGYRALFVYDDKDRIFTGQVMGIREVVCFHADSVEALEKKFQLALDDYLAACAALGQSPNKPYTGKMLLRVPPEASEVLERAAH